MQVRRALVLIKRARFARADKHTPKASGIRTEYWKNRMRVAEWCSTLARFTNTTTPAAHFPVFLNRIRPPGLPGQALSNSLLV